MFLMSSLSPMLVGVVQYITTLMLISLSGISPTHLIIHLFICGASSPVTPRHVSNHCHPNHHTLLWLELPEAHIIICSPIFLSNYESIILSYVWPIIVLVSASFNCLYRPRHTNLFRSQSCATCQLPRKENGKRGSVSLRCLATLRYKSAISIMKTFLLLQTISSTSTTLWVQLSSGLHYLSLGYHYSSDLSSIAVSCCLHSLIHICCSKTSGNYRS